MDWQIIREIRLLLEELPNVRFWAVWFLLVILIIGFVLQALGVAMSSLLPLGRGGHP
jgi:uncharacterized membrane protein YecN with MAPEG domain